jgi:putative pyruvate formate lyase activating enzyme
MLRQTIEKPRGDFDLLRQIALPIEEDFRPGYLRLLETGELYHRVGEATLQLDNCELCAVRCGADRRSGQLGRCRTGELARVSSYGPHMSEESVLSGIKGSGTIFFGGCSLRCQYCQSYDISQTQVGREVTADELAEIMLELQDFGCHNIHFVTPEHVVPQILQAVLIAAQKGLEIPLVWNSGGYDALESLCLLNGVIDIYQPDMKYSNAQVAKRYSRVNDYPQINQDVVREMYRQVGNLVMDEDGIARRGLLVRHLVLPNGLAGTQEIVRFLAEEISPNTYINLISSYRPTFQAHLFANLNRPVSPAEFQEAVRMTREAGLSRIHHLLEALQGEPELSVVA